MLELFLPQSGGAVPRDAEPAPVVELDGELKPLTFPYAGEAGKEGRHRASFRGKDIGEKRGGMNDGAFCSGAEVRIGEGGHDGEIEPPVLTVVEGTQRAEYLFLLGFVLAVEDGVPFGGLTGEQGEAVLTLLVLDEEKRCRVHRLKEDETEQGEDDEPAAQGVGPEQALHADLTKSASRRRRAYSRRPAW